MSSQDSDGYYLVVSVPSQKMQLFSGLEKIKEYKISTARNGVGEEQGSEKTPRGLHYIRAKIGAHCPAGTVFRGRRQTGEIYTPLLAEQYPNRDWILTRILWLCGLEPGKNRFGSVDTMKRFIYMHGCPDEVQLGTPNSKGCIRMRNKDIIELFNLVPAGTKVSIEDE